jgi:hypothetical protein
MERLCSNCALAQEVTLKSVKEEGTVIRKDRMVLNDSTSREVSWNFILRRGCEQGVETETVDGFDKCISEREFTPKL